MEAREGQTNCTVTCVKCLYGGGGGDTEPKVSDLSKLAILISVFAKQCQIAVHGKW